MISKWDLKQCIKSRLDEFPYLYNEENESFYDKGNGAFICTLDEFLEVYRKKSGQSFESIFYEHGTLENILRCTECGTVIFTMEDEDYDEHLKCPTCTDYKPHFEYWTREEIEQDETKQNTLKAFKEIEIRKKEEYERRKKRNGKYDWQIGNKEFRGKKLFLGFYLECENITKSYFKGLRLLVHIGKKDGMGYVIKKHIRIPLSWSQFYIQFIYPHLGKCHPSLRSKWYIGKPIELTNKVTKE